MIRTAIKIFVNSSAYQTQKKETHNTTYNVHLIVVQKV